MVGLYMKMEWFGFKFMTNLSLNLLVITWKFSDLLVTLPAILKCCRIGVHSRMLWKLRILISHICDMSKCPSCIFLLQFLIFLVMISVDYLLLLENLLSILQLSWMFSCTLSWSFLFPVIIFWSGLLQLLPFLLSSNHSSFHMLKCLTQWGTSSFVLAECCCKCDGFKYCLAIGERTPFRNGEDCACHTKHMGYGSLWHKLTYWWQVFDPRTA